MHDPLMSQLNKTQLHQEAQYYFPYNYSDLVLKGWRWQRLPWSIEYLGLLNIVKDALRPFNRQLVLDAGCRDGRLCYELKQENVTVVGVDYSQQAFTSPEHLILMWNSLYVI